MVISVFDHADNTVRKGGNASYKDFLLFLQCVSKGFCVRVSKTQDCVVKG